MTAQPSDIPNEPPPTPPSIIGEAVEPPAPPREPIGSWPTVAVAVVFGVAVDRVMARPPGMGIVLVAAIGGLGVIALARPAPRAMPFFLAGFALASFALVHAEPALTALDVLAAVGLFAWGASFSREGAPATSSVRAYAVRGFSVFASLPSGIGEVAGPPVRVLRRGRLHGLLGALALTVPVVVLFTALLASADPVFAHLLRLPVTWTQLPSRSPHLVGTIAGAIAFGTLLARARTPLQVGSLDEPVELSGRLKPLEWKALLASVDVVFAAFVLVQFAYFFGGRTRVLEQEGLTFAEYARSGFAQLLASAALTGCLIAAAWTLGTRRNDRDRAVFRWLAGSLVALTLVVLVSAFRRLTLYEGTFGYTWSRLLGHAAVLFLGAFLVCGIVAIASGRTRWLPTAAIALGFVTLFGLSAMSPDRFVAEHNLARFRATGKIDVDELRRLSPDATPAIVAALPTLPERQSLAAFLACERDHLEREADVYGWTSFNASRDAALASLNSAGLGSCPDVAESYLG